VRSLAFLHGFLGSNSDWLGVIKEFNKDYLCNFSLSKKIDFLIGYSMGGRIAMNYLGEIPIILIASHPGLETDKQIKERVAFEDYWLSILENETLDSFLLKWYSSVLFSELKTIPKERFLLSKKEIKSSLLKFSLAKQPSFWNTLSKLTLPLLYIVGEKDTKYREIGDRLAYSNPHIQVNVVNGASHAVHLEKPKEVADLIETFIGD
jgi:2-succinyl-6-hydroxy-2,4-cyclohexadiene-1-carboxylate synthase